MDKAFDIKSGLKTVLADEFRPENAVPGSDNDAQQMSFLPAMPLRQINDGSMPRGRGRPQGSKNKNTEEWRNYLLSKYRSPLEVLAETYSRSLIDLAAELGYFKKDEQGRIVKTPEPDELAGLLKIQLQCAKELAPFVHQKQPQAIDAGDNGLMQLIINTTALTAKHVDDAGVLDLDFIAVENEENQRVSETENVNSVVYDSVVSPKTAENCGKQSHDNTDQLSVGEHNDERGDECN